MMATVPLSTRHIMTTPRFWASQKHLSHAANILSVRPSISRLILSALAYHPCRAMKRNQSREACISVFLRSGLTSHALTDGSMRQNSSALYAHSFTWTTSIAANCWIYLNLQCVHAAPASRTNYSQSPCSSFMMTTFPELRQFCSAKSLIFVDLRFIFVPIKD